MQVNLPSTLLEEYIMVLGACVYCSRSQPYFLLYSVLFGLKIHNFNHIHGVYSRLAIAGGE